MDTTFELVRATRGLIQGRTENLKTIFDLSVHDIFFQLQFIMCDEKKINDELENFYLTFNHNAFMLETPDNIADVINQAVTRQTTDWMRINRQSMLQAERNGVYTAPVYSETYIAGSEIMDAEYTKTLASFMCTLPELYRQTALAFYYCNLPVDVLKEELLITEIALKNRITYIEKILNQQMHGYCKDRGYQMKPVNSQRIRTALYDLAKLYKYPYGEALYNNIRMKIH